MTRIDLHASFHPLEHLHRDLIGRQPRWPSPTVHSPLVCPAQFELARTQWEERTRATYASLTRATHFFDALLTIGAPLDILHGTSYILDELTRHLSICAHILDHFHESSPPLTLDTRRLLRSPSPQRASIILFELGLDLFGFNLAISYSVYEALSAVTSDSAIAELCRIQSESIAEMVGFGQALLLWLHADLQPRESHRIQRKLPTYLDNYEVLSKGTPQLLDELAGEEIILEAQSGNLGSLNAHEHAAIFYHFLNANLFPAVEDFGWSGPDAWRRHYREDLQQITLPVIAAIGLPPHARPQRH